MTQTLTEMKREVLKVKIKHWNATQLTQNVSFIVLELINPGMKEKDLDHYYVNLSGELKLFASLAENVLKQKKNVPKENANDFAFL